MSHRGLPFPPFIGSTRDLLTSNATLRTMAEVALFGPPPPPSTAGVRLGSSTPTTYKLGSASVAKLYKGDTQIWP